MNPLDWILKLYEILAKPIISFFESPQMEIEQQNTWLGWSDHDKQRLALLVWVKFTNTSEKPFLLRSLEVERRGVKYKPVRGQGVVSILGPTGWRVKTLHPHECAVTSPQIPAINVARRFGFFPLPKQIAEETGRFEFEVTASFQRGRSRTAKFVIDSI